MSSIAHIAIIVGNLDHSVKIFTELLGNPPYMTREISEQNAKLAIFRGDSDSEASIELISPLTKTGHLSAFLEKRGEGLHHIALKVKNIEKKLSELSAEGFKLIDEKPGIGAEGKKIAFVHPLSCSGVLVELIEE